MYERVRLLPYGFGSRSGKHIADTLGIKRLLLRNSSFRPRGADLIINWGNSGTVSAYSTTLDTLHALSNKYDIINSFEAVKTAVNKLDTFNTLKEKYYENIPDYTTDYERAKAWLENNHVKRVCQRTTVTGSRGEGLTIVDNVDDLQSTGIAMYTHYIPKKHEYALYFCRSSDGEDGWETLIKQKKRQLSCDSPDYEIRCYENGWIFANEVTFTPSSLVKVGTTAADILGLDFGRIDIAYNELRDKCYLLEINTAPSIRAPTTLEFFRKHLRNLADLH